MQSNPSCTFGDLEPHTELAIVQIVPETSAHERPVEAREAVDRARKIGLPEHVILVGVLGGEIAFLEHIRTNGPYEAERLVAGDA